jgi:hypothetical protein
MKSIIIVGIFLTSSCGQLEQAQSQASENLVADKTEQGSKGEKGDKGDKGDKGEKGDDGKEGQKGEAGEQGTQGEAGKAGETGAQGFAGQDGKDGNDGTDGLNGTQGVQGIAGSQGIPGEPGESSHKLILTDMANRNLGEVYYLNDFTGYYWVVRGNMRFEIEATGGTFPNAYLAFSGANCTGEKRVVIINGKFANVFVDGRNGTPVKASGANLGSFPFQSRVSGTNSCSNEVGSTLVSYIATVPVLAFPYPLGRVYIENE